MSKALVKPDLVKPSYRLEPYKLIYRACIPFYVLLDDDLSKTDHIIYGLIEQMESSLEHVFISNQKIAHIVGISVRNVQLSKAKMIKKNYIKREFKQVKIKEKLVWMHCFNTVKGGVANQEDLTDDFDDKTTDKYTKEPKNHKNQDIAEIQRGDPVDRSRGDPDLHPSNTIDSKAIDLSVCSNSNKAYNKPTLADFQSGKAVEKQKALNAMTIADEEIQEIFKEKFGKFDIAFEEMLYRCVMHFFVQDRPTCVTPDRFRKWIIDERIKYYKLKPANEGVRLFDKLTQEDKELLSEYQYRVKDPVLTANWKPIPQKDIERAKQILKDLNEAARFKRAA